MTKIPLAAEIKGPQPEVLASLKVAAKHDGMKPLAQGMEAQADTAPEPSDPDLENAAATAILHENAARVADQKK